jgi:23S rRNA (cytidine1920-2'-O)/16S rRNA (cytidine1409-2'-O)-methyltransferase
MRTCTVSCRRVLPTSTSPDVAAKSRLDAELVRRGLARSRDHAQARVSAGRVRVGGLVATKVATAVDAAASVQVLAGDGEDYVSRGGHKLAGALDRLGGPPVGGRRCLDAGASTGGFTDVLLRRGASEVVAVDVGYGQLAWSLRTDARVRVIERTNVRTLTADTVGLADLLVADLSFISLTLVLPALLSCVAMDGDALLLVKPQFEAGRDAVGSGGVVRDPAVRAEAVRRVAAAATELGWGTAGVTASPLPGPAGNVEYFLWLRRGLPDLDSGELAAAIEAGPA